MDAVLHAHLAGSSCTIKRVQRPSRLVCGQAGYAVIFLNRRHSIQPFTKGLPSGQILDFLTNVLEPDAGALAASQHAPTRSSWRMHFVRLCSQVIACRLLRSSDMLRCAGPHHGVHVADSASDLVASCVERAREAAESRVLLRVPFETLFQYLQVRGLRMMVEGSRVGCGFTGQIKQWPTSPLGQCLLPCSNP